VTSLAAETDAGPDVEAVREPVVRHVATCFGADVTELRGDAARGFLNDFVEHSTKAG